MRMHSRIFKFSLSVSPWYLWFGKPVLFAAQVCTTNVGFYAIQDDPLLTLCSLLA